LALASVVVALGIALSLGARARDTVDAYGQLQRVSVARRDLEPGREIASDDVTWRELPAVAVPDRALTTSPTGRVVTAAIGTGEVVTDRRIAPEGLSGLRALVPPDRRAIGVPVGDGSVTLEVGDAVDVLAPSRGTSDLDPSDGGATVVARAARVLAVGHSAVVLAVSEAEATPVAGALAEGVPVLVLDPAS
jgi:Flp pilus assembly protein CpaB